MASGIVLRRCGVGLLIAVSMISFGLNAATHGGLAVVDDDSGISGDPGPDQEDLDYPFDAAVAPMMISKPAILADRHNKDRKPTLLRRKSR
jgi:hypothetical protein